MPVIEPRRANFFPTRVLLSGGSGLLGGAIRASLGSRGFEITSLVRRAVEGPGEIQWDPKALDGGIDHAGLARMENLTAAIHLSGANVASRRWTPAFKVEIRRSRVETTSALAKILGGLNKPPGVLVSASAIGYFGNRGNEILDEHSAAGHGFFPDVCSKWEEAALAAAQAGIRVVHPRFGVVISQKGGAMERLKPLFKLGLGGNLGSGHQWMSWISEPDAIASIIFAMEHREISGAFNSVSPEPITNAEFTRELAKAVHRPAFMTAPAFALRLAFGEMADEALLASTRAVARVLLENGFPFRYPSLSSAFEYALGTSDSIA